MGILENPVHRFGETIEEEVLPLLRSRLDTGSQTLAIPPREMADLMMDRLHYTVLAKTINRRMFRIERVDQLCYMVNNDTIVARQLPISIVAVKPERVVTEPVTIWDFGTITEACPVSPLSVIGDSDDFLMLELRGRSVACDQLELGWLDPSAIARDLSVWTTRDQRRCGEHPLVLHRRDLPPAVEEGKRALAEFHTRVMAKIDPEPVAHRDHPIWVRLQTLHHEWRAAADAGSAGRPRHRWTTQASEHLTLAARALCRTIFGRVPDVGPFHPYWIDLHPTILLLGRILHDAHTAIAIWSTPRAVLAPRLRERLDKVREYRIDELADDTALPPLAEADLCLLELTREDVVWFRGGRVLSALQRLWDELLGGMRKRRGVGVVRFVLGAALAAPLTYLANRAALRQAERGEVPRGCTSVCMEIIVL